jgi:hypothetical protein
MLAVARDFAAAVCRARSVDADTIDDVLLGVTEAMSVMMDGGTPLSVSLLPGPSQLAVRVEGGRRVTVSAAPGDLLLGTALIEAIADGMSLAETDDGTTITFTFIDPGD